MHLILVRHGQSGNNLIWERTRGSEGRHPDTPLTDRGLDQAARLAEAIGRGVLPWRVDAIYTSLMSRAVQTAAPIAEVLDLPMRSLDIFEAGGPFEEDADTGERTPHPGLGRSALLALSARLKLGDDIDEGGWWRREVEAEDSHLARAERVLADLRERHESDVVLLVTHGYFTQYLLRAYLSIDKIAGWIAIDNTSVTLLCARPEWPDSPLAQRINWTPHLQEHERTS